MQEASQTYAIAIVGVSGRFPDAKDVRKFWENLCSGRESIVAYTDQELLDSGMDPNLIHSADWVKAGVRLADIELFDAKFFGFTPREAEFMDPQQRLLLECGWEALEDAGYDPIRTGLRIGVFAGTGSNSYFQHHLLSNPDLIASLNYIQRLIITDNDFLATRLSYKLNLKGPSLTVQTACSTSLVATHLACQSLLNGECDMALAGGVFVKVPQVAGYSRQEGSPLSPDGKCRAFDASANGMVPGSGAGVVVLKRLEDALADRDSIRAVIRGSAVNNDGADKIGYTAPSVEGQARVIAEAQAVADVRAEQITYVETHGTGTILGDPIEVAGLSRAFRQTTDKLSFCAIGSLKTNIGHLGPAAGIAGLIKVVLAMENKTLPPSLHFAKPNPAIDFANSPFYVQRTLSPWQPGGGRRIAGVSSFGIGGTNAHVIVEEAPPVEVSGESPLWKILPISARTEEALEIATDRFADFLEAHPEADFADVAFTLQQGRKEFEHRRIVAAKSAEQAALLLRSREAGRVFTAVCNRSPSPLAFMFPGQAAQRVNMTSEIYASEKRFRQIVDFCCEFLQPQLGFDLREKLFPTAATADVAEAELNQTRVTQPAMFVVEYALAKLWMEWGITPDAMIGHSIGEYVAACLADVFSLEDALLLVAARGRFMQSMPAGSMLAVHLDSESTRKYLGSELSLAAINGPESCVAAGPTAACEHLQNMLVMRFIRP
jgi:acyl transferase domain-containing protein